MNHAFHFVTTLLTGLTVCLLSIAVSGQDEEPNPLQLAKDTRTVETLLRLKTIDPNTNPKLKAAVLRYLESVKGTPKYLEVVEELKFADAAPGLLELALANASDSMGVQAARALLQLEQGDLLLEDFRSRDTDQQLQVAEVLGGIGNRVTCTALIQWLQDESLEKAVRQAAMQGLLRSPAGQERLAKLIEAGELPVDLTVVTAAAIGKLNQAEMSARVAPHLPLPESADAEPLPPLATLVSSNGDADLGQKIFNDKGTCSKCHVIGSAGKEVGPNLSEIGSKLSREAMFLSILDPSAGISHNYETYFLELIDGEVITGILLSEAAEDVTVKTAEALIRKVERADIELLEKQKVSLMPEGLQKNLTASELVSLVDYLMTLKKVED